MLMCVWDSGLLRRALWMSTLALDGLGAGNSNHEGSTDDMDTCCLLPLAVGAITGRIDGRVSVDLQAFLGIGLPPGPQP